MSQVRPATSNLRQPDQRNTFAAAAATGTSFQSASKWVSRVSNSSPSNWRMTGFCPSIQVNWDHGFEASSLASSTTPRTHFLPAERLARSNEDCKQRLHLRMVLGEMV